MNLFREAYIFTRRRKFMYKIVICVANLKHYDWWKGKPVYQFDTLDEVIRCLKTLFPPNSIKDWESQLLGY